MAKSRYRVEPDDTGQRIIWHVQEEQPLGNLTTWATIATFYDQFSAVKIAREYITGRKNPS